MKQILAMALVLILAACGGGNDTSGGGGTAAESTAPGSSGTSAPAPSVTYTGTGTITLTAPGLLPISETAAVTLIRQGPTLTVIVGGESVSTTINGDSFSVPVPVSESQDGISCAGVATVTGTVTDSVVNANLSGSGNCTGQNLNVPVTVSGSLTALAQ